MTESLSNNLKEDNKEPSVQNESAEPNLENLISIILGKSEDTPDGFKQFITVSFEGKVISLPKTALIINKEEDPKQIPTYFPPSTEKERRYINHNQAYWDFIELLPGTHRQKGLGKAIYQKVANELNLEIVRGDTAWSASANGLWKKLGEKVIPRKS